MNSNLLYQFVDYSNWLMLLTGLLTIKSLNRYKVAYYFWFLLCVGVIDFTISRYFKDSTGFSTRLWYTILRPIEYWMYLKLFLISSSTPINYFKYISFTFVACFSIYTLLFRLDQLDAATSVMIAQKVALILLLFIYFRKLLEDDDILLLSETPLFWLAVGLFFFAAGNIVATGFYHQIYIVSKPVAFALYNLNFILGILQYLLTIYCFYLYHKKRKVEQWKTY